MNNYRKLFFSKTQKKHNSGFVFGFWILDIYKCPFSKSADPPSKKTWKSDLWL